MMTLENALVGALTIVASVLSVVFWRYVAAMDHRVKMGDERELFIRDNLMQMMSRSTLAIEQNTKAITANEQRCHEEINAMLEKFDVMLRDSREHQIQEWQRISELVRGPRERLAS